MKYFTIGKRKAQRTLKHFHTKKFLFTAEDLIKQGIHLKGLERKNPQIYYLTDMKARIIESRRNNVQVDTTDITTDITTLETQKIQYLQDMLLKLSDIKLHIHKLQIKTKIDKENYDFLKLPLHRIAKIHKGEDRPSMWTSQCRISNTS
jgi:hypothetical protein